MKSEDAAKKTFLLSLRGNKVPEAIQSICRISTFHSSLSTLPLKRSIVEIIAVKNDKDLIESVSKLADEVWREHYKNIISQGQIDYMLAKLQSVEAIEEQISSQNYEYYLIRPDGGQYAGYFAIVSKDGGLFLSKIYILKEERRKGFSRISVDFIKKRARELSLPEITLMVARNNKSSIEAYLKIGFAITGNIDADIGNGYFMNDYNMVLKI